MPVVSVDHVTAFAEVSTSPFPPATFVVPLLLAAAYKMLDVPEDCWVQLIPSGELNKVPPAPAARKTDPFHVTEYSALVVGEVLTVQFGTDVTPSGEVRMVPLAPMTTTLEPLDAMA